MKKKTAISWILVLGAVLAAPPAFAQTRVYVAGDIFAEITQSSRTTVTPELIDGGSTFINPDDGVSVGGGARVGAFFSPVWSLEIGFDAGKAIEDERTRSIGNPLALSVLPSLQFTARTSQSFAATSVLVGYHPVMRGRIHPGFRGGISFMHAERGFTVATLGTITVTPGPGGILLPNVSLVRNEYSVTTNGLTGTLAAEAAIESEHFAVVPEMRAHAGGIGGFLLRPGVAARWRF